MEPSLAVYPPYPLVLEKVITGCWQFHSVCSFSWLRILTVCIAQGTLQVIAVKEPSSNWYCRNTTTRTVSLYQDRREGVPWTSHSRSKWFRVQSQDFRFQNRVSWTTKSLASRLHCFVCHWLRRSNTAIVARFLKNGLTIVWESQTFDIDCLSGRWYFFERFGTVSEILRFPARYLNQQNSQQNSLVFSYCIMATRSQILPQSHDQTDETWLK